jgi:hypothetical protein
MASIVISGMAGMKNAAATSALVAAVPSLEG